MKRNSPTLAMLLAATLAFTTVCPAFAAEGSVEAGNAQTASAATEELVTYEMAEEPDGVGMDADPDQDVVSEANNDESGNTEEVDSTVVQETEEDAAPDETVEDEEITDSAEEDEMDLVQEADQKDDETGYTEDVEKEASETNLIEDTEEEDYGTNLLETDGQEDAYTDYFEGSEAENQDEETAVAADSDETGEEAAIPTEETKTPAEAETVSMDAMMNGDEEIVASGTCGDYLTWTLNEAGTLTISGTGDMANYNYYDDTRWDGNIENIKIVIIEDGVTSIGYNVFYNAKNLTSVTIPGSVTTINLGAFSTCGLTEVYYGASEYDWNLITGRDDGELRNSELHCAISTVSGTCGENLTWALDEEGILTISGTGEITDTSWSKYKTSIKKVIIDNGVTRISENAFQYSYNLEDVTISSSVKTIGAHAFDHCSNLTSVMIPLGVTSIGAYAFYECQSLTSVVIPDGVTKIENNTFGGYSTLKSVTIPLSVTEIEPGAFSAGTIEEVYYGGSKYDWYTMGFSFYGADIYFEMDHVSGTCGENLTWTLDEEETLTISGMGEMTDSPWRNYSNEDGSHIGKRVIIEDGVTSIADYAFSEFDITSISIPASVTEIGDYAFEYCYGLKDIYLSDIAVWFNIASSFPTENKRNLYINSEPLTDLIIPEGITSIESRAFYGCDSLTSVVIPASVKNIGDYAFYDCDSLTSVVIPASVKDIGDSVFYDCDSLTRVTISEGVTAIGSRMFSNCSSLESVAIPLSVTSIGYDAFSDCLKDIYYSGSKYDWKKVDGGKPGWTTYHFAIDKVSGICGENLTWTLEGLDGDGTLTISGTGEMTSSPWKYYQESDIKTIIMKNGVTSIQSNAFSEYDNLTSVTIPESVTTIGGQAFYNCKSLTSITIPDSVTTIDSWAFYCCSSLADVYYLGYKWKWDQINIYSHNDSLVNATLHTYISIDVSEISLDKTSAKLHADNTMQLAAVALPENATYKSVSWISSDDRIATVDDKGLVKAVGEGTATITATAADGSGVTATCTVTVFEDNNLQAYAEGTRDSRTYVDIQAGKSAELRVTVSAVDESELSFQWYDPEGKAIEGATDLSYTAAAVNGNYRCEVRDQYGSRCVVEFYVQVDNNLQVYVEGKDISETDLLLAPGETSELRVTVSANDESDLSCQWYDEQARAIEGATGTSYTIEPVTRQTQYEFRVSDRYGNTAYARFYVQIGNQLRAYADGTEDTEAYRYVTSGESAKLQVNVSADDKDHLRYQWFKIIPDAWGKLEYYTINGATGASYTVNSVTGFTRYYCRVQDQYSNRAEVRFYTCIAGFDSAQTISCGDAVSASANSEAGGGAYPVYRFIPAQTAKYVMYSTDGVDDPYLEILNDSHDSLVRTASPFEDPAVEYDGKGHFRVEQVLEKGKTYYLVVGSYSNSSSCVLHLEKVNAAVTGIKLNKTSANLNITKTLQLTATVLPDDATDKSVNWTSSNRKAATVDSNGKVRGVGAGTATITAAAADGSGVTATCTITVSKLSVANVTVSGLTAKTYTGKALTQTPTVKLGSTTLKLNTDYKLSYTNNTNAGTATLTVTGIGNYTGTKKATFTINKAAQKITAKASAASVAVGKTVTISVTGAKGKKSYKSSNTAIATVTTAGSVAAKKVGTVKITATSAATANFKAASKTVTINVVPAATASLKAENQPTGIKLTWKKVTGANGYKVYRGSTLVKNITSGSTVTYTDTKANTNGTKYTFKIVAKASIGDSTLSRSVITYRVARPAISSAANSAAGKMTVKWAKNAKANGYQLQYSTSKTFASGKKNVNVAGAATVSKAISSLAKGKTYYVRLRTYKTVGSTKHWSAWSATKTVKINK